MNFLKTFFGQILRKGDVDFAQSSGRDGVVNTHTDLTNSLGGVVNGLDVYRSDDGLSVLITPGVFYNGGPVSTSNGIGGGERGEVFTTQSFTNLPDTPNIGNQPSYLVVYVKTTNQTYNPDPTKSQATVTSKNIQTGENIPVRSYTNGSIAISNPVLISQVNRVGGIPLAVLQVTSGYITIPAISVKRHYTIGNVVDVFSQTVTQSVVDKILSQVKDTALIDIKSTGINVWDGTSVYNSLEGDGIANQHLKDGAVTSGKINAVSGLNNFSVDNYVFNGSFEIVDNSDPNDNNLIITGWDTWIQASGSADTTNAFGAVIVKDIDVANAYHGSKSVYFAGVDPALIPGTAVGAWAGLKISQDISFSDVINNTPVMASLYMKSNTGFNAVTGASGIVATIQFLNGSSELGEPIQIAQYTGNAIGWTRFGLDAPVQYTDSTNADGIRFVVSGTLTNTSTVYFDQLYVGLTNIEPAWTTSQADKDYSDTLEKQIIFSTNIATSNLEVTQINPKGPSDIGSVEESFNNLYVKNIVLNGTPIGTNGKNFIVFDTPGLQSWPVPVDVSAITVRMWGAGGGGGGGAGTNLNSAGSYSGGSGGHGEDSYVSSSAISARGGLGGEQGYTSQNNQTGDSGKGAPARLPSISNTLIQYGSKSSTDGVQVVGGNSTPQTTFLNLDAAFGGGSDTPGSDGGLTVGGGGGGAAAAVSNFPGYGGAGGTGEYAEASILVTPGSNIDVNVGTGGSAGGGGAGGGGNGKNGGKGGNGLVIIYY